jgi:hypothetical protein
MSAESVEELLADKAVDAVERIAKLETALRKIRGLTLKRIKYRRAFKQAVIIASDALGVKPPPMSGETL